MDIIVHFLKCVGFMLVMLLAVVAGPGIGGMIGVILNLPDAWIGGMAFIGLLLIAIPAIFTFIEFWT